LLAQITFIFQAVIRYYPRKRSCVGCEIKNLGKSPLRNQLEFWKTLPGKRRNNSGSSRFPPVKKDRHRRNSPPGKTTNRRNMAAVFCSKPPSDNPHYVISRSKKAVPGINPSHGFCFSESYIMPTDYRTACQSPRPPARSVIIKFHRENFIINPLN